jgi:hypothetical protein
MEKRVDIDKKLLMYKYIKELKSSYVISLELKTCSATITNYLHRFGIKIRTRSENTKLQKRNLKYENILTYEYLYTEYIINKKSVNKISEETKVDNSVIYRRIKKYNIPMRTSQEANTGEFFSDKRRKQLSEARKGKCLGSDNFNYGHKWTKEQKERQGIITQKAMDNEEIKKRMSENHADVNGDNNPMYGIHRFGEKAPSWIDGRSYEPYPLEFRLIREQIRKRDNYTCQNCSMTEEEHLIVIGNVLEVHHIDYNKKNCVENNLITLCKQCNLRANKNRDYWQKLYKTKLLEKVNAR